MLGIRTGMSVVKIDLNRRLVMADEIKVDEHVDITHLVCPNTFVKTKVVLDDLEEGQVLSVRLSDGEPVQNVPRSLKEEGHEVLRIDSNDDGTFTLYVRKVGD